MKHGIAHYKGIKLIVLGVIILLNEIYFRWPWFLLFGCLLILKGIMVVTFKGHMECCKEHKKHKK